MRLYQTKPLMVPFWIRHCHLCLEGHLKLCLYPFKHFFAFYLLNIVFLINWKTVGARLRGHTIYTYTRCKHMQACKYMKLYRSKYIQGWRGRRGDVSYINNTRLPTQDETSETIYQTYTVCFHILMITRNFRRLDLTLGSSYL